MFSPFSLISLYKRFGSLLCLIFFVLWLCKKKKENVVFEQDGYKTFGEKMLGVSCCKFVTSQDLTIGNLFMGGGVYEQLERFWRNSQKCTFQSFVAFLRKDGTKMKRKSEGDRH